MAAATTAATGRGDETPAAGVVVLRNGNVLEGAVRRQGAYYRIEQAGATLQVPAGQVESACRTLAEAYEIRRRERVGSSTDAHLELARWCLRHDLLAEAAREILDARTGDPEHPALAALDLQLRQQLEVAAAHAAPIEPRTSPGGNPPPPANDQAPPPEIMLGLSAEAQAAFVRSTQPMLIHGCTTGGCHQPNSQLQLQLDRWAVEGNGNPSLIRRNLESVLAQVDPADPASSPLMRWARQSHGAQPGARPSTPLASYQAAMLLEWLNEVAGVKPEPPETAAPAPAPAPLPDDQQQLNSAESLSSEASAKSLADSPEREVAAPFKPKDPFDPEAFNRQHRPHRPQADEPPAIEADPPEPAVDDGPPPRTRRMSRAATPEEQAVLRAGRAGRKPLAQSPAPE